MSIRLRLLVTTAVVALIALLGADVATYISLRSFLYGHVDSNLELSHHSVEASISAKGPSKPSPSTNETQSEGCKPFDNRAINSTGLTPGTVIEVRNRAGHAAYVCAIGDLEESRAEMPVLPSRITGFSPHGEDHEPVTYFNAPSTQKEAEFRVRASIIEEGPAKGDVLLLAVPLTSTTGILGRLEAVELAVTAAALVAAAGLAWWLVRAGLRPLRDVELTAEAISAGQLTERVPGHQARTEVGRVARAFNVMLERIEAAFAARDRTETELRASQERMRQFVADASHELRTPLAAVRAYAELFDRGAETRPEDLQRVMHGIQAETGRMSRLVEDLLLLAHLDEGAPMQIEPVDLTEVADRAVTTARDIAPDWPITLTVDGPVAVEADALRVRQVLDNLIGNVRVHCPAGTTTTVTVAEAGDEAELEVSDDGPGLSDEDTARLFERFFRADPSRSRLHGGAGLGLAIVAAIVHAHGGYISVSSSPGGGTRFTVRLPKQHRSGGAKAADELTEATQPR